MRFQLLSSVVTLGFLAAAPLAARGQDAPAASQSEVIELAPVKVTARKREEAEQKVPISMTVLEGEGLQVPAPASNNALARNAPNVGFTDAGGQSSNLFSIRGVGSFFPLSADDTSTVMYVGEAPLSVYGPPPSLLDVERVEILRGPQGTLFGRNTQAGAINIVPNAPRFDWELEGTGEGGTSGYGLGELIANAPLVEDILAARLALRYSTFDGDIRNVAAGGRDGEVTVGTARGTFLLEPNDATSATLAVSYDRHIDSNPRFLLRDADDFPVSEVDPRTKVDSDSLGATLHVTHDFGPLVLDSVTSAQRNHSFQRLDPTDGLVFGSLTGLPPDFFNVSGADLAKNTFDERIYQHEVRLSSPKDDEIAWTAGLNFFRSELDAHRDGRAVTPAFATTRGLMSNDFVTNSYSAFGEATVPLIGRLDGTLGLRFTHEDKWADYDFDGDGQAGVVASFRQHGKLSDDFVTGRVALSYEWAPELTTYASVARGTVTAGFPSISANTPLGKEEDAFPASNSWTYEAGFKSALLDNHLVVNGALFMNDVKDGHLVVFDPANAAFNIATLDYRTYGGELEFTAKPMRGLSLFGGIGYTHANLVDVPSDSATGARSGNRVPNIPRFTANLGAEYRVPGEVVDLGGDFIARIAWQYAGDRAVDVANSFDLHDYSVINARLGWEGAHFSIYGFVQNAFDERYETWGQNFSATTQSVRVGQGRIIGAGTTIRF
ncbi:TonB-dependent receptor [Dongia sedimenti]|uniref:TonB-dependent receptor n=1 Tax=Dongia sedimenti TaxID=3064282 RepID=A0ABU0YUW3_9PROT|nr:TonB-dependent receptor [Rhodospirillaceae bacterium R-7]